MKRTLLAGAAFAALAGPLHAAETDIVIGLNEELETVEPCMASQSNIGRVILQNVSETLMELDFANGTLKPRLAESWTDQGDGTWRLNLRKGVTFSDGTDFDAADVVHSLARATDPKMQCEIGNKSFPGIKTTAKAVDANTVDVTFDPPQAIAPLLLSGLTIVPAETPMEFTRQPIGTGPYAMTEWTAGQRIVLERRDGYWGETPAVTKATYVFRSDDAVRAAMVPAGEADIVPAISLIDATNPATDFAYPNSEVAYVRIDSSKPPLNDIRVRQALNMAVDRNAFLGTLLPEQTTLATHITPPSALGADVDLGVPPFDLEKARALIAAAKADGVPVDAEILFVGRTGIHTNATEVDEALQQMFEDAGLNVKLQMMEVGQWLEYLVKPFAAGDQPSLVYSTHDNNRGDPVFSMRSKYACDGEHSGTCDAELDKLIAAATAASGDERAELWRQAFQRANDLSASVLLFNMVGFSRVSERLDFRPTLATNGELQLSEVKFK